MRIKPGNYFVDREQPPLSAADAEVARQFHELYYRRWTEQNADTINLSWFGHELLKCPLDLWVYQELLVRTRPDFVVETGTYCGGSALYFAMLFGRRLAKSGHCTGWGILGSGNFAVCITSGSCSTRGHSMDFFVP